jgi:hypothetical protein
MRFFMWAKSWFLRLQVFLRRELLIFRFRVRSFLLLQRQQRWHSAIKNSAGSVEIIIPFPAQGRVSTPKHDYYLRSLRKLITTHLPRQTYTNYCATIYCDGENPEVSSLLAKIADHRFSYRSTDGKESGWGHVQTRLGILESEARFIVRMNCDNEPFPEYLEALISGFADGIDAVYGRVIYSGPAAREHLPTFADYPNALQAFVLPKDKSGALEFRNIDCMNYMVRSEAAKPHASFWSQSFVADWDFIREVSNHGLAAAFVDRIIGCKC